MISHEHLIQRIFETFFPGLEYLIEPELSYRYLYNIKLLNVKACVYCPHSFTPDYVFNNTDLVVNEHDLVTVFRNFAPTLESGILIYTYIYNKNRILVTPEQIRNENYGILSKIKDPFKNRFDVINRFLIDNDLQSTQE